MPPRGCQFLCKEKPFKEARQVQWARSAHLAPRVTMVRKAILEQMALLGGLALLVHKEIDFVSSQIGHRQYI